jgi:hypothetical protein
MGAPELTRFLSSLAADGTVAASTQNQTLSALLFLYRDVLELEVPWLDDELEALELGTIRDFQGKAFARADQILESLNRSKQSAP